MVTELWRVYRKAPVMARLHVVGRAALCPLSALLPYFPPTGTILEVGCGHGILLHLLARDRANGARRLVGIDHAPDKLAVAAQSANGGIEFSHAPLEALPAESFDAVSLVDVLYTIELGGWKVVLDGCFRVLKPGGRLIVKEVIDRPRWKYWLTMAQELLAVELLRITRGHRPHFESLETYRRAVETSGFRVTEVHPLRTWWWTSHCLFVGEK